MAHPPSKPIKTPYGMAEAESSRQETRQRTQSQQTGILLTRTLKH
jgi:hypothetical protein